MKTNPVFLLLITAMLALAGCKKSKNETATAGRPMVQLQNAFPSPGPDVAPSLQKIGFGIRYGQLPDALAELEKLGANPSLTAEQKKVVSEVTESIKKTIATPPKPAQ